MYFYVKCLVLDCRKSLNKTLSNEIIFRASSDCSLSKKVLNLKNCFYDLTYILKCTFILTNDIFAPVILLQSLITFLKSSH